MTKSRSQRETRIITREEEAKLVAVLRSPEVNHRRSYFNDVADLVEVMADTGLRQMEALELMYRDIDFTANVILVRQTKSNPRRVPVTGRVATILERRQEANQDKPFNLNEMQIRMAWTWAKEQIGLKDDKGLVLYALRRTCAIRMMEAKIDMEILQEILTSRCRTSNRRFAPTPIHKLNQAAEQLERWRSTTFE